MADRSLHIQLLGDFRLTDGETPVTAVNSARMQSLLAYLLLHRAVPQPRYHVAFLLWPDSPEGQARSNLRNLIHRLRHAFPEIESFLLEDNRELCWRADGAYTLDVAEFETAIAQAKRAEEAGDQGALQEALEQATGLYTGDLLPSCYDEWILLYREHMRQDFLEALEKLSVIQENQGYYRQAINSAERLLRYDPLHETIYRRLMQLYSLCGDRTGALRVYQTCTTVLKRELDIAPDAATRAVYESLLVPQAQPAAKTSARVSKSLPDRLTSFIGREKEMAEARRLMNVSRLLTLCGPFGSGKTRLGLEVADRLSNEGAFPGGVWWVELAPITDASLIIQAVAEVIGAREKPGQTQLQSLIEALQGSPALLLLDNCEHLITACSELAAGLLRACPRLHILATSREALNVMGEVAWPVPPLAFPAAHESSGKKDGEGEAARAAKPVRMEDAGQLLHYEAIRLFSERAASVLPTFQITGRNAQAVAQVCRRLEGLPLAIELAAARVKMMSVEQIAARLDDALPLLKASWGGELPHHQTLQAAIDWSYNLLSAKEQALLRRLSVFTGGFSLEAAEQATAFEGSAGAEYTSGEVLDLLSGLIDKSLVAVVEREQGGEIRYRLLEIVRQYTRKKLSEAAEVEPALSGHAGFFLKMAEEAQLKLRSAEQKAWLRLLDLEHDNLRAALQWSKSASDDTVGLRLAASLWQFWDVRGEFTEGRRWLEEILAKAPNRTIARAKALNAAGGLAWGQSDFNCARAFLSESLAIQQEIGEKRDIAAGLLNIGILDYSQGDYASAKPLFEQSLEIFRELGHRQGIANVLNSLGVWASDQGDYAKARPYYEESLALRREMGDKRGVAIAIGNLGVSAWRQGDCRAAQALLQESLERYRELGDKRGSGAALNELGSVALQIGQPELALTYFKESQAIWQELENNEGTVAFLEGSAGVALAWADAEQAARLLAAAESLRERNDWHLPPVDRASLDRLIESVKSALDPNRLAVVWSEGRMMSLDSAVDLAASMEPERNSAGAADVSGRVESKK